VALVNVLGWDLLWAKKNPAGAGLYRRGVLVGVFSGVLCIGYDNLLHE